MNQSERCRLQWENPEVRKKRIEGLKLSWADLVRHEERCLALKGSHSCKFKGKTKGEFPQLGHSVDARRRISEAQVGKCQSLESNLKRSSTMLGRLVGEKNGMFGKRESPEHKEWRLRKVLSACRKKPTSLELILQDLIGELGLPYAYCGNGELIIGCYNPDFVNTNGQKKLIEVFGDYWHELEDVGRKSEVYAKFGFETLVIWEHEVRRDIETVKRRVLEFDKGRTIRC